MIKEYISGIGTSTREMVEEAGRITILFLDTLKLVFVRPFEIRNTMKQMYEIGVKSVPVVFITGTFTGMVLALQTYTGFKRFGAESLVGSVVAMSMLREMGPVLTGLIVTGRAGAAIAAELGTMRVTEQIDALETLSTNPIKYLVVPRVVAGAIMLPCLTIISDIIGILGGYLVTVYLFGASPSQYWNMTWNILKMEDFYNGLIKAFVFGVFIALLSCYKGFYAGGGAEGVGKATNGAVVLSFMAVLISNYFIASLLYQ